METRGRTRSPLDAADATDEGASPIAADALERANEFVLADAAEGTDGGEVALRSGETVERVAADLRGQILDGRFAPGQRLISRDLMEQLGVSRGSLREAFRRLEADGLVEVVPNRGAIVRKLSRNEVVHIFQIREALEGFAARLAAMNIHQNDNRERFAAVLDKGRRHAIRPVFQGFVEDNRLFHQEILRLCANPQLGELIDKYQMSVFMVQLRQTIGVEQMIGNSLAEHEEIGAAILGNDPDGAYRAMKRHLWHSADLILKLPTMAKKRVFIDTKHQR